MLMNEECRDLSVRSVRKISASRQSHEDSGKLPLIDASVAQTTLDHQRNRAIQTQTQRQTPRSERITAPRCPPREQPKSDEKLTSWLGNRRL